VTVGAEQTSIPATADVREIVVRAGAGDDSVKVELTIMIDLPLPSQGEALPPIGPRVTVEGGDGNDDVDAGTSAAAVLLGGAGDDRLAGGGSRDVLRGGAGNDHLIGGPGRDNLWGGAGDDTLEGGEGRDRIRGGAGGDTFTNTDARFERRDFGPGDELLRPLVRVSDHAHVLGGVLYITGSEDADEFLLSQTRDPQHPGAAGLINYFINLGGRASEHGTVESGGITAVSVNAGGADDRVDLGLRTGPPNHEIVKTVTAVSLPATLLGGDGNDQIHGGNGGNVINGGEGEDYIAAGHGDDRISGGAGADTIRGELGRDTFFAADAPSELLDRESDEPVSTEAL
jgi:Ca2+-binding RTX toxin-like protein